MSGNKVFEQKPKLLTNSRLHHNLKSLNYNFRARNELKRSEARRSEAKVKTLLIYIYIIN